MEGFSKIIVRAVLCDYYYYELVVVVVVVYLPVAGLSPKRQAKVLTVTSEKYTPLLSSAWTSPLLSSAWALSSGSHWKALTDDVLPEKSTLSPRLDVRLSSAVKSLSVEQVPCSTLKQVVKVDLIFFIWAVGVSSIVSAFGTSVLIGPDTECCSQVWPNQHLGYLVGRRYVIFVFSCKCCRPRPVRMEHSSRRDKHAVCVLYWKCVQPQYIQLEHNRRYKHGCYVSGSNLLFQRGPFRLGRILR
jgi:hypothetical protein